MLAILKDISKTISIFFPKLVLPVALRRFRATAAHIQLLIKIVPHIPVNQESNRCGNRCSTEVPMKSQGEPIRANIPRLLLDKGWEICVIKILHVEWWTELSLSKLNYILKCSIIKISANGLHWRSTGDLLIVCPALMINWNVLLKLWIKIKRKGFSPEPKLRYCWWWSYIVPPRILTMHC